jgi:hypothetical protein
MPPVQPVLTSQQSDVVLGDQGAQQVAVFRRMARHEGGAEAGGEGRLRLGCPNPFRAGDLGGEAGQEVVHGLGRGQPGDGRQHAKGIRRQHDHMFLGCPARPVSDALGM